MSFPKNRADYIIMTVVFIIFTGATIGGIMLHIKNSAIEAELKQKRQQLTAVKRQIESLQNTGFRNSHYATRNENQPALEIPFDRKGQELFKVALERLAQDNNLRIIKSEPEALPFAVKNYPQHQVSQWRLILSGNYRGLLGFLETLPRTGRLAMISKLNITSEYLQGNQYRLTVCLTLDIISRMTIN